MTAEASKNEALEKLNQGIEESRRRAQQQTMEFAQEYFDDSVEELRQQARDRRATLENLPDQVPGGYEESFRARFEQLMEKFSRLEACLEEVRNGGDPIAEPSVAESSGGHKEVNATDAARREARKLGIDLTQVEGTGSGGRIVVWDVTEPAGGESADQADQEQQTAGGAATRQPRATDAARRKAEEAGIDLSEVEGTGSGGNITVDDVTSMAESSKGQTTEEAGQAAQAAQDTAEQAIQQAQDAIGKAGEQVGQIAQQTQQAAGEATSQAQDAALGGSEEPRATNAARRKAEEMGVDLTQVEGTGSDRLITLEDVTDS